MTKINGWDERDYKLWSALQQLQSYGLIAPNDYSVSIAAVRKLIETQAETRLIERASLTSATEGERDAKDGVFADSDQQIVWDLEEKWAKVWKADKAKFSAQFPAWMVSAATEIFAHDYCDAWNMNEYVSAVCVILSRNFERATAGVGAESGWKVDAVEREDEMWLQVSHPKEGFAAFSVPIKGVRGELLRKFAARAESPSKEIGDSLKSNSVVDGGVKTKESPSTAAKGEGSMRLRAALASRIRK